MVEILESEDLGEDEGQSQTLPPDRYIDDHAAERGQTQTVSVHTRLSTSNSEAKTTDEEVINKAILELREFDLNKDGRINSVDRDLLRLVLFDRNEDGEVTEDEMEKFKDLDRDGKVTEEESREFERKYKAMWDDELGLSVEPVKNLDVDVDTVVKVIHDLAADKELDMAEAIVLHNIPLSSEARSAVWGQIDQAIKSGAFDDVKCQIYEKQMLENCVIVAEKMVLAEFGKYVSEAALTIRALLDGTLAGPDRGASKSSVGKILERFEIAVDRMSGLTINELEAFRQEGRVPIIALDADEIWKDEDDDNEDKGRGANHAVVFLRVDRSDPDNPMVIVNDSGIKDGKESAIPLDRFKDAWEDAGYYAVVTKEPAPPLQCEIPLSALPKQERDDLRRYG